MHFIYIIIVLYVLLDKRTAERWAEVLQTQCRKIQKHELAEEISCTYFHLA